MSQILADEGCRSLPMGSIGTSASGWWGAWFLIISDSMLFLYLFFSYFWYSVQPPANWVPGGPPRLHLLGAANCARTARLRQRLV